MLLSWLTFFMLAPAVAAAQSGRQTAVPAAPPAVAPAAAVALVRGAAGGAPVAATLVDPCTAVSLRGALQATLPEGNALAAAEIQLRFPPMNGLPETVARGRIEPPDARPWAEPRPIDLAILSVPSCPGRQRGWLVPVPASGAPRVDTVVIARDGSLQLRQGCSALSLLTGTASWRLVGTNCSAGIVGAPILAPGAGGRLGLVALHASAFGVAEALDLGGLPALHRPPEGLDLLLRLAQAAAERGPEDPIPIEAFPRTLALPRDLARGFAEISARSDREGREWGAFGERLPDGEWRLHAVRAGLVMSMPPFRGTLPEGARVHLKFHTHPREPEESISIFSPGDLDAARERPNHLFAMQAGPDAVFLLVARDGRREGLSEEDRARLVLMTVRLFRQMDDRLNAEEVRLTAARQHGDEAEAARILARQAQIRADANAASDRLIWSHAWRLGLVPYAGPAAALRRVEADGGPASPSGGFVGDGAGRGLNAFERTSLELGLRSLLRRRGEAAAEAIVVDGRLEEATWHGLRIAQRSFGLPETGRLDDALLFRVLLAGGRFGGSRYLYLVERNEPGAPRQRVEVVGQAGDVSEVTFAGAPADPAEGEIRWSDGRHYRGTILYYRRKGNGVLTFPSGAWLRGTFGDQGLEGLGASRSAAGAIYEGEFRAGRRHGRGTEVLTDGFRYEGEFRWGEWHGRGVLIDPSASGMRLEGRFVVGRMVDGIATFADGDRARARMRADGTVELLD